VTSKDQEQAESLERPLDRRGGAKQPPISRSTLRRVESYQEIPIAALESVAELRAYLQDVEDRAVKLARARGATWEDVAQALGVSRQTIHQRHNKRKR
jgi:predicted DNA-binding protein (UPF0251 family)